MKAKEIILKFGVIVLGLIFICLFFAFLGFLIRLFFWAAGFHW